MAEITIDNFENVEVAPPQLDPGDYKFNIREEPEVKTSNNGKPYLDVNLTVVDGPAQQNGESPVDRTVHDRVYLVEGAYWRIKQLLIAAGLLDPNDKESPLARGKFNTAILVGAMVGATVQIQKNPENGREYRNYQYTA